MEDILDALMGVDKKNEIFCLWYELNFLRIVVNRILAFNPDLHKELTQEVYDQARKDAQDLVQTRFPNIKIDFSLPGSRVKGNQDILREKQEPTSPLQEDESKRKAQEALRSLRTGWFKHPDDINEDQKEVPIYTPQDPQ